MDNKTTDNLEDLTDQDAKEKKQLEDLTSAFATASVQVDCGREYGQNMSLVDKDAFMKDHLLPYFDGNHEEAEQMWQQLKPRSKADADADVFVAKANELVEENKKKAAAKDAADAKLNVIPLPHPELLLNIPNHKVAWAYLWLPDKKTCKKFQLFPAMLANKVRNHVEKLCGIESKGLEVWVDPGWLGDGPVLLDPWKSFGDQGLTSNFVLQVVEIGGDPNRPLPSLGIQPSPPSEISSQPSDDEEEKVEVTLRLVYDKVVDGAARGTRSGKNLGVTVTEVTVGIYARLGLLLTTVSSLSGVAAERLALFYKGQQVLSVNKTFEELGAVDGDQFQVALARGI